MTGFDENDCMVEFYCGVGGDHARGGAAVDADVGLDAGLRGLPGLRGCGDGDGEEAEKEGSKHGNFFDS